MKFHGHLSKYSRRDRLRNENMGYPLGNFAVNDKILGYHQLVGKSVQVRRLQNINEESDVTESSWTE